MASNTQLYSKRFDFTDNGDYSNFFAFAEDIFQQSKKRKDTAKVIQAREAVESALDSNWLEMFKKKNITAGGKVQGSKRVYPNKLISKARAAASDWVRSGFCVEPNTQSSDQADKDLAEASAYILRYLWDVFKINALSPKIALDLITTGMAILWVRFDKYAGSMVRRIRTENIEENGAVIGTKPAEEEVTLPNGEKMMRPIVEYVPEGNIDVEVIHPATFFPDHTATKQKPPRWVLICKHMPLTWAEDRFPGIDISEDTREEVKDPNSELIDKEQMFLFCEYFEANSPSNPQGAYCAFANFNTMIIPPEALFNPGDKEIGIPDEGQYFPCDSGELPFVIYYRRIPLNDSDKGLWTTSDFYDALENLLLAQKTKSNMVNYMDLAAKMPIFVPDGSGLKAGLISEYSGKIVPYNPVQGGSVFMPQLAPILNEMMAIYNINNMEMDELLNIREIDTGTPAPNTRSTGQMQMQVDLSASTKILEAEYNEGQDYKLARILLSMVTHKFSMDRIKAILGEYEAVLVNKWDDPNNSVTDPRNVKIEKGSRSKESKNSRQQKILFAMQQNPESFTPEKKPWILEELDFQGGKEAFQRIDLEKKYTNWKIEQLLMNGEGADDIQPMPGENIPMQLDMMIQALYGKILSGSNKYPDSGKQMLANHIFELAQSLDAPRKQALKDQVTMEQAKNSLPVVPFEYNENMESHKQKTPVEQPENNKKEGTQ